jgi:hypothetical protein
MKVIECNQTTYVNSNHVTEIVKLELKLVEQIEKPSQIMSLSVINGIFFQE